MVLPSVSFRVWYYQVLPKEIAYTTIVCLLLLLLSMNLIALMMKAVKLRLFPELARIIAASHFRQRNSEKEEHAQEGMETVGVIFV